MYADPSTRRRFSPVSFGAALLVNTALVGALMFAAPNVIKLPVPGEIPVINLAPPPPPPPPIPDPVPKDKVPQDVRDPVPFNPKPVIDTDTRPPVDFTSTDVLPKDPPPFVPGTGTGEVKVEPAPPPLIGAFVDPRYSSDFQPEYPASEIRNERQGKVAVRVRIGIDGRVKEVRQVSATSPAFFEATRRQALGRWRFKPASRGGQPEESWKTMNVTFVLTGG